MSRRNRQSKHAPVTEIPALFWDRLRMLIPATLWEDVVASFAETKNVGVRTNTLHPDARKLLDELHSTIRSRPLDWYTDAFLAPASEREHILGSPAGQQHALYLQNPSSMIPPVLLEPEPGQEILDLAAAPGSKTGQLAQLMQNCGRVAAVEKSRPRFFKLRANLEDLGATCVQCYHRDGIPLWRKVPERFDGVLLDAPCSSEGRFRANEAATYRYWGEKKIKAMASTQRRLAVSAVNALKPGGYMVYSTCSFAPEENEAVVDWLLRRFRGQLEVSVIDINLPNRSSPLAAWKDQTFDKAVSRAMRILPDQDYDGFFVCRLRKVAPTVDHTGAS